MTLHQNPKLVCSKVSGQLSETVEKSLFPHQNVIPTHNPPDLQYVVPWKCHGQYGQPDVYGSNFNGTMGQSYPFLPNNPFNYCSTNINNNPICNRFDVNSLRYRHQEFSLTP